MSVQRVRVKSGSGVYSVYVGDKILPQGLQAHLPAKVPVAMLVDEGVAALPLTLAIFAWLEKRASRVVRVSIPAGERPTSVLYTNTTRPPNRRGIVIVGGGDLAKKKNMTDCMKD